jgi:hypothetical protein
MEEYNWSPCQHKHLCVLLASSFYLPLDRICLDYDLTWLWQNACFAGSQAALYFFAA